MDNKNKDFLKLEDNFSKIKEVSSIAIIESKLNCEIRITIAIPTFKRADLLKEAIESAIDQIDYTNYEIIVVDNNPERLCETETLLMSYDEPRLSYYKNSVNIQMAGNWNRAFELAKGEYVVLLHDDDLLLPTFLSECAAILNKRVDIGILKPLARNMINGKLVEINSKYLNSANWKLQRLYDFSNFNDFKLGAPTGCIFKREDVIKIGGFNQDFFPVMDFCFAVVLSQQKKVYNYNKYLSIYRISDNESMRLTTLTRSFEYAYYVTRQILEKYKFHSFIINWFLSCKLFLSIDGYKSFNKEFCYNIENFGLKEPNKLKIFVFKVVSKIVNLILNFCTTKPV